MAKLRVYELAEQMNKTNKEILSILKDKGIEVASHMSTLSDEQIDAVKSEKTSEDTPKKKNIVQVFRPQNSQGGGRGRNGQGRPQGSRNGQRPQGNGNGQGRPQGNGNRQERPQNGNSQGRPQGNGQGRPQNGNRQERPQGNGNGQGRPQNGNRIVRREKTVITDSAEIQTDQETVRIRDRDARVMEEEMADSRTAETEEIIEITVITETEERCVMADAVTTEENPARLFRHLQSQNRNQAATNQKMRTRRKNITEMKRTKTDCRKAKRAKTITLSRKW
mgnify:CR=1 FL=1